MKIHQFRSCLVCWLLGIVTTNAAVRYVDLNSATPTPPYTDWATAATNIQDAVDAAVAGDQILVTNGVYQSGGRNLGSLGATRLVADKSVAIRSVNGSEFTLIYGDGHLVRCVSLSQRASLSGFTLTNGTASGFGFGTPLRGGGVYCYSTNEVVSDCVLVGNHADFGGGAYGGTLIDCTLTNNSARYAGGGAAGEPSRFPSSEWDRPGCRLINCTLAGNWTIFSGEGGGAWGNDDGGCALINCTLTNNSAFRGAGAKACKLDYCTLTGNNGDYEALNCTLNNCTLKGRVMDFRSSVAIGVQSCNLNNCELTDYTAGATGARNGTLNNCTLTRNSTGVSGGRLNNCIVYGNGVDYDTNSFLNFCCTKIAPDRGQGNMTNAPLFADYDGGNLRLQSNSPCINAGLNTAAASGLDLDGSPRLVGGTVDIGAYEFQSPSSVLSYAWAQQYGLSTDGSADYADADSDRMNNWQEWIAGTAPTDAASALRMSNPTTDASGVTVSWQSVSNRTYFLERTTNLGAMPPFSLLTNKLVGQPGTTSFTDTNATGPGPFFYRVGVQQ